MLTALLCIPAVWLLILICSDEGEADLRKLKEWLRK
jgi:hypothetical protein